MTAGRSKVDLAAAAFCRPEGYEDARLILRTSVGPSSIGLMPPKDLERIQITPLSQLGDTIIEIPAEWMAPGVLRERAKRTIRLSTMANERHPVGSPGYMAMRLSILRALLALWLLPGKSGSRESTTVLKPSSYVRRAHILLYLARVILADKDANPAINTAFGGLTKAQVLSAVKAARGAISPHGVSGLIAHLDQLRDRGAILDWLPQFRFTDTAGPYASEPNYERARKGLAPPTANPDSVGTWQPLPDTFVSEQGWRALWLIENLGPSLITCLEKLSANKLLGTYRNHPDLSIKEVQTARTKVINNHEWVDAKGVPLNLLPFPLTFGSSSEGIVSVVSWPPSNFVYIHQCVTILQACHMFSTLMATGARWSEAASLTRTCLQAAAADGEFNRLEGRTFKLIDRVGGAARDWPLHPLAAAAIQQQILLANCVAPGSDVLWVVRVGGTEMWRPLLAPDPALGRLTEATGTRYLLNGTNLHSHRFRKTIARLAALTLVGAPKILMDLFGHRSIEMTLRYILSDPALAAEVQEISKAMVVMLGREVIETAQENGGPAASHVRKYVNARTAMRGEKVLGVEGLVEAAETLTANGRAAALVRTGVVCLKQPGQAGPCTQRAGHPDPSRCQTGCDHRLDFAAAKHDATGAIEQAIEALRTSGVREDRMMWAFWQGQIIAQLQRFDDLAARFRDNPEVAALLAEQPL